MAALQLFLVSAHECEGSTAPRSCTVGLLAVNLDRPHADFAAQGQQTHARAGLHGSAPRRSGHDRSRARESEHAIDWQPKQVVHGPVREIRRDGDQRGPQLVQALSAHRRNRQRRVPAYPAPGQPLCHLRTHHAEPFGVDEIALGEDRNATPHTEQLDNREMLFGLRHDSFVRGNDEEGDVDAGRAGEHVLDEAFVTGDVDDAGLDAIGQRKRGEPEIDRDAAPFLFFPPIGIDPGERLYERGLAVVDMSRGADYEPAEIHARRSQISMALDRCSLPFCATSPK